MIIKMTSGNKTINVNGTNVENDVAPHEQNDRTFVPIRFVAENLGYNVDYNAETQEVTIYDRKVYFDSADECAIDWAMCFMNLSIGIDRELSACVFKDDKGYFWTPYYIGNMGSVVFNSKHTLDKRCVALLHTHGNGGGNTENRFSSDDGKIVRKEQKPLYLVAPCGCISRKDYPSMDIHDVCFISPANRKWADNFVRHGYPNAKDTIKNFLGYWNNNVPKIDTYADFFNQLFANDISFPTEINFDRIELNKR